MDAPNVHHAAGGLREALTHKIGPFPGYVWALGAGGLLALYLHGKGTGGGGTSVDPTTLVPNGSLGGSAGGFGTIGANPPDIQDTGLTDSGGSDGRSVDVPAPVTADTGSSDTSAPALLSPAVTIQTAANPDVGVFSTPSLLTGSETPADLQRIVATPNPETGIFPASNETPIALASPAAPPGGLSANSTQGVFGVDLGNMDYPVPSLQPTPTSLQESVSTPDAQAVFPAPDANDVPFAITSSPAAPPGGLSANYDQGVFAVDLGHMDYPTPAPVPVSSPAAGGFPVDSVTDASSSGGYSDAQPWGYFQFPVETSGYAEDHPIETHETGMVNGELVTVGGNLSW